MKPTDDIIFADYRDTVSTANQLIDLKDAHQKSRQLLEQEVKLKRKSLAASLLKSRKTAFRLGYKKGIQNAESQVSELIETAKKQYDRNMLQANTDCMELAVKIASEIIHAEIQTNTESLSNRIKSALEKLVTTENLQISANPAHMKELQNVFRGYPDKVSIKPDPSITAGNAIIENETGQIDLNWKTQLEIMRQLLINKIRDAFNIRSN